MSKSPPRFAVDPPVDPPVDLAADELSAEELALLGRVRRHLQEESVPSLVRQRLQARVLDEVSRAEQGPIAPAAQLVPVQGGVFGHAAWWLGAAALVLVLLTNARGGLGGSATSPSLASDSRAKSNATGALGEGLLRMSIFREPAQVLSGGHLPGSHPAASHLPAPSLSLFSEQPFSARSRAWQVRRWDDLQSEPVEPAAHDFEEGALCVELGGSQRVLGGWPWLGRAGAASQARAPEAVALVAGKPYRLGFKAWAREPLPAQLLVALGHASLPFSGRAGARVPVSTAPQPFVVDFVSSADDPSVGIAFLATGAEGEEHTRVCLSDVTLTER